MCNELLKIADYDALTPEFEQKFGSHLLTYWALSLDTSLSNSPGKPTMKWMSLELPRRYKARYGASMASEIHKNVTLQAGEEFLYSQFVRERKNLFMAQPRLLTLTASRLFLLEHNLFAADWILEVPRFVVTHVFRDAGGMKNWVSFNYSNAGEDHTVRVQPMLKRVSEEENQKLFSALNAFHCGQLNSYALGTESVLC